MITNYLKRVMFFLLPIAITLCLLILIYCILDPFKVIKSYESFYEKDSKGWVSINRDFISTMTFINNNETNSYDAFILGNSRSIYYEVDTWKKYIGSNKSCFHFDASSESLWGINKKLDFINKQGNTIKNILLVLDHDVLSRIQPKEGHLFITSPPLVNNSNHIRFHKTFLSAFLNPKFIYAYLDFKISGKVKPYMKKNSLIEDRSLVYDPITNEERYEHFESLIHKNRYYTPERMAVFYERDSTTQKYSKTCIYKKHKDILNNIKTIVKKHNSKVKVIINPLYDQLKLSSEDIKELKSIFGVQNVFDFSGINTFTNNYKNYYESSHYRPHVAKDILGRIYN